jgi:membrane protein DedA with SNARE-associated domain
MEQIEDPLQARTPGPHRLIGLGSILAQSKAVAEAFGKPLGFVLMVLSLIVFALVGANALYWIGRIALG